MKDVSILSLRLVRERDVKYESTSSPDKVVRLLEDSFNMSELAEEIFVMICLNSKTEPTGIFMVSQGALNMTVVHPREVFKRAITNNAVSIIVAHNHPSGSTSPSHEDRKFTTRLKEAGEIIGIKLLDHLIIGDGSYLSFKEEGMI